MSTALAPGRAETVHDALATVVDPELDEPITAVGFVRSVRVSGADVTVHLRLPTSFCSPSFAYLMASDAKDALVALPWTARVTVELDDHHDSAIINAGLAADAGYRGTFGAEALDSLDELRTTFARKAHTAAMEQCLTALLRTEPDRSEQSLGTVTLGDLPRDGHRDALLRRRAVLGLRLDDSAVVLVDHAGTPCPPDDVPLALRRARATRISVDGNAHFCRGLLRTRYPGAESDQTPRDPTFVPLETVTTTTLREHR